MNRIDEMIATMCPDGVVFKEIGSVTLKSANIRWPDHLDQKFQYIDLTSVDRITHAITETTVISAGNAPSRAQQIVKEGDVIFGTTRPTLKRYAAISRDLDGQICSTGFCVMRPNPSVILTDFLFHLLGTHSFYDYVEVHQRGAGYPAIPDGLVRKYRIPVPPLEIQQEIVDVLNSFLKLEAELEAELEARRAQYHYYRDDFMSLSRDAAARVMTLGELGEFVRGSGIQKSDFTDEGVGCIHYGEVHTHYGTWAERAKSTVSPELAAKSRMARTGDLVIATTSEDDEAVGKAVAWLGSDDVAVSTDAYIYRHELDPKYAAFYFQSEQFQSEKRRHVTGAKVRRISGKGMAAIRIPVPPKEEQRQIADLLDKFEALVTDLSSGLPAEINARRKQYAHYRDQLMDFEKAA